jgi:hypothetical protein
MKKGQHIREAAVASKDAEKPPYEPTPMEAEAIAAYRAAKGARGPRIKVSIEGGPIVTMFKDLAEDTGACIELVIHPRKTPGEQALDEQDIIGSVGLPNKTRDVRVLNAMTAAEASRYVFGRVTNPTDFR